MWEAKKFISFEFQRDYFGEQGERGEQEGEERRRGIIQILEDCDY